LKWRGQSDTKSVRRLESYLPRIPLRNPAGGQERNLAIVGARVRTGRSGHKYVPYMTRNNARKEQSSCRSDGSSEGKGILLCALRERGTRVARLGFQQAVQGESGYGETLEWWGRVTLQQTMVAKAMAKCTATACGWCCDDAPNGERNQRLP
jgi:hypothetical protein